MITIVLLLFLVLLILTSAFVSGSETAFFSLSPMKIKLFRQSDNPRKQLSAKLLDEPHDLLITLMMVNVLVNVLIQNVVSTLLPEHSTWLYSVLIPLAITLIFGEIIPKTFGMNYNEAISVWSVQIVYRLKMLLLPVRKILTTVTLKTARWMFFFLKKDRSLSIEELQYALAASRETELLRPEEEEIIRGYLHLQASTVQEFTRPREEVIFYDLEDTLEQLIHFFVDQEVSKIPVCQGNLDQLIGVISCADFFQNRHLIHKPEDLHAFIKKPIFAPETMAAEDLLRQLYDKRESLCIVVDEYGAFSGIVTLEDLIEVVVGKIADRRDQKKRLYTRSAPNVIIASGRMELHELEQAFGCEIKSEQNVVTVGGYLTAQLGDIPKTGTKFVTDDFLFHVLASDPNRVRRIYIRYLREPANQTVNE